MLFTKLPPFRVYRELETDEHLCLFADPAEGNDYCAAAGISKKHSDIPIVFNDRIESSQFGYELQYIAKYIEMRTHIWPTIGVERNVGQATIYVLGQLNYPDMFRMHVFDKPGVNESSKIGWLTTEGTRKKMLDDFALAVRQGVIKIYDKQIIDQMRAFVISKKGRPQAESNKKDDLVIASAGAYQLYLLVATHEPDTHYTKEEVKMAREKWRFK